MNGTSYLISVGTTSPFVIVSHGGSLGYLGKPRVFPGHANSRSNLRDGRLLHKQPASLSPTHDFHPAAAETLRDLPSTLRVTLYSTCVTLALWAGSLAVFAGSG